MPPLGMFTIHAPSTAQSDEPSWQRDHRYNRQTAEATAVLYAWGDAAPAVCALMRCQR